MTNTFRTMLLGSAAVLTLSAGGALANDTMSTSSADAQTSTQVQANAPSSPDANTFEASNAGGQEDEYVPGERDTLSDAVGGTNDGTQNTAEANADMNASSTNNAIISQRGGQEDEYAPGERDTVSDAVGGTNDGTQSETEADVAVSADINAKDVASVQQKLNDQGYKVSVDGVIGNQTREAIRSYQSANNLSPTGQLDSQTMTSLQVSSR